MGSTTGLQGSFVCGTLKNESRKKPVAHKYNVEIAQTIKQNKPGIRNSPGTALKNAINGEVIYTPPCCEDVIRDTLTALEK